MSAPINVERQDHIIAFFRGFLNRPKEVGSIIPSSRFMEKRIVETANLADAKLAIELGPGTGGTSASCAAAVRNRVDTPQ